MELRKDEEEEEKEEIEEIEEEKEYSQEEENESQKNGQNLNQPHEDEPKLIDQDVQKMTNNSKEQSPKNHTYNEEDQINNQDEKEEEQDQDLDLEETSTYILKYTRKGDELNELSIETGLRKSENCLFMLNIKLIKSDSISIINQNEDINIKDTPKGPENFLVFCCHEIAAIYFDEIYERIYTLKDLAKENKYFKVFESTEEAKNVIDETIRTNEKNAKKIFLAFKDKELKLHMKLSFFDKEKEIVLNIPKKSLTDNDKVNLLPEFLKEIQDKMNHLNEENKKLKAKKLVLTNRNKEIRNNYKNNVVNEFFEIDKDKKEKSNINNNSNNEIKFNGSNKDLSKTNNINLNNNLDNINNIGNSKNNNINHDNNDNNGNNATHKKGKKSNKTKKRHLKPEENFF